MNFGALEKSSLSPGNLFLKKGTNSCFQYSGCPYDIGQFFLFLEQIASSRGAQARTYCKDFIAAFQDFKVSSSCQTLSRITPESSRSKS